MEVVISISALAVVIALLMVGEKISSEISKLSLAIRTELEHEDPPKETEILNEFTLKQGMTSGVYDPIYFEENSKGVDGENN